MFTLCVSSLIKYAIGIYHVTGVSIINDKLYGLMYTQLKITINQKCTINQLKKTGNLLSEQRCKLLKSRFFCQWPE